MTEEIFGPLLPIITVREFQLWKVDHHFLYIYFLDPVIYLFNIFFLRTGEQHSRECGLHKIKAQASRSLCLHQ